MITITFDPIHVILVVAVICSFVVVTYLLRKEYGYWFWQNPYKKETSAS